MITARGLLRAIDGLSFRDRQRLLAEHGRRLAGTPELAGLLDDLHGWDERAGHRPANAERSEAMSQFARRTGLLLARVAGERGHVERCLSGVETGVLRDALTAAVRLGLPAAVLVARLPEVASALRTTLYQEVRRAGATELAAHRRRARQRVRVPRPGRRPAATPRCSPRCSAC